MRTLLLLLAFSVGAAGQIELNPAPRANPGTISVDVDLVNVLCTVRDRRGSYMKDLRREDFVLLEDGKTQQITHFARDVDTPITVALLLDVSGSVALILNTEKAAAERFFDEILRPDDRAMLVGFAQLIGVWQDLTSSKTALQDALAQAGPFSMSAEQRLGPMPRGGTLLYDAIDLVAIRKLLRVPGRKAMVLITDGMDNGSKVNEGQAAKAAQEADTVIYGIHYEDESGPRNRTGMGTLESLSKATGGRAFHVDMKMPLPRVFEAITEDMRNQYSLGYAPASNVKDGGYHKIEVKVSKPGVKVAARAGYYSAGK